MNLFNSRIKEIKIRPIPIRKNGLYKPFLGTQIKMQIPWGGKSKSHDHQYSHALPQIVKFGF